MMISCVVMLLFSMTFFSFLCRWTKRMSGTVTQ